MTIKTKRQDMSLICKLTDEEVNDRAVDAGEKDQEIQNLENSFDEARKEHKAQVGNRELARRVLLREIRTRQTTRLVDCEIFPDFLNMIVRTTRLDTGEVVRERPMTEDEKQGRLIDMDVENVSAEV